jgi:serine/threonine protein kinase
MADFDPERDPVDVLAEEFAERFRQGETPSVSEYVARHPEWAEQLRDLLPPVARIEQLKRLKKTARAHEPEGTRLEQLGDYRIVREVGRGGMGIVYEAVQLSLGRHVALKVLPGHALLDPKKLERFRREAQAAAALHHTNIVPVFGVGAQDGLHYYVMQLIAGQGLDRVLVAWRQRRPAVAPSATDIRQAPTLDRDGGGGAERTAILTASTQMPGPDRWREVARIGVEAAEALHYAHQQGTLHRDIKPANLLLDQQGTVWVTDFGLAKLITNESLTSTGDILGTIQYMAPEALEGRADARSDVYSLGLTLYELLTLEPPFGGQDLAKLLESMSRREPASPRKRRPTVPRDLDTIIQKATAREPERRYQTAQAIAADLRRFRDGRPIQARRSTPAERLWRWSRRNPLVAGLTAALVVVFLAGFAGVVWKWREAAAESARAEENLHRAEGNAALSLHALEEIFDNFGQRDFRPGGPKSGGPPGPWPRRFSSEEDAALLQIILKFYDQFAEQNATNGKLQREAARAYRRVGDIQQLFRRPTKAAAAYRRAAALLETFADDSPAGRDSRREWADLYTQVDFPAAGSRELAEVETGLRKALKIAETDAQDPRWRAIVAARAYERLGTVLRQQQRLAEAERAYRQAVDLKKKELAADPGNPFARLDLAIWRRTLAGFLLQLDRPREARDLLLESIADIKRWPERDFGGWARREQLTEQYPDLVAALRRAGEPEAAAQVAREAEQLRQSQPPSFRGQRPGSERDKKPPS